MKKSQDAISAREYAKRMCHDFGVLNSSYINRFLQPDSIIPGAGNPQNFNRYSYVGNNPINFSDPSGHARCSDWQDHASCRNKHWMQQNPGQNAGNLGNGSSGLTISSLGQITVSDVAAEITLPTVVFGIDPNQKLDFTGYLASVLTSRTRDPRFLAMQIDLFGGWFGLLEAEYPSGGWDIKIKLTEFSEGAGLCDNHDNCGYYDPSTLGNIQLGYIAGLLHMHKPAVDGAGGFVNTLDVWRDKKGATDGGCWNCDDSRDQAAVDFGYALSANYPNGITREALSEEIGKSTYTSSFEPPPANWAPSYPASHGPDLYGPNDFDNGQW